jgi:cytochrome d ubiquinol oxidase subunit I
MVSLGSMLSAVWIVVANSWQQTPAGYHIVREGLAARAEITDFWALLFNPSSIDRISHVLSGAWLAGAFLVLSISAYYIIKNTHLELSKKAIKISLSLALFASLFQLFTGHNSALGVADNQPEKLAAFEAHYDSSAPAAMYLFGWVNDDQQEIRFSIAIPKGLSFLISGDFDYPVTGLNAFKPEDIPPVNLVFQSYHFMVTIGFSLIGISVLGAFLWWRGKLFNKKWYSYLLVFSVLLPQAANQLGWISAEVGRQPWIVYKLLRTSDGLSKVVEASQIWFSLILFFLIYTLLFILFIYLLNEKIKKGPDHIAETSSVYSHQKGIVE